MVIGKRGILTAWLACLFVAAGVMTLVVPANAVTVNCPPDTFPGCTAGNQPPIDVSVTIDGPPPVQPAAPTITSPADGATFHSKNNTITVRGSCTPGLSVSVFRGGVFAGSTICQSNSKYQVEITIFQGANVLVARQYNGGVASPDSNVVTVYYQPKKPGEPITTNINYGSYTTCTSISEPIHLPIQFSGGVSPYAVSVDWGDGDSDLFTKNDGSLFYVDHSYATTGSFSATLRIADSQSNELVIHFQVCVSGVAAGPGQGGAPVAGVVPGPIGDMIDLFKSLLASPMTAYVFPLIALGAVLVGVAVLSWQILLEACKARLLTLVGARGKNTADEKLNFMELCANFLRTPLTAVESSSQALGVMPEVADSLKQQFAASAASLRGSVESIINSIQQNPALRQMAVPQSVEPRRESVYQKPAFWLPVVGSIVLTVGLNILVNMLGSQTLDAPVYLEQTFVIATIAVVLFIAVRELLFRRRRREEMDRQLEHRGALDKARNYFALQARDELARQVSALKEIHKQLPADSPATAGLQDGINRLQLVVTKFTILAAVESARIRPSSVSSRQLVDEALQSNAIADKVIARQLVVSQTGQPVAVTQDKELLRQVVNSVLDNAVTFSKQGGAIKIDYGHGGNSAIIKITDEGAVFGREPEELFASFEQGGQNADFSKGGTGISLYLDRLIMRHLGGLIRAKSIPGYGAEVELVVPTKDILIARH